ncbi:immunoglobulin-like domain-containing protein [Pectobacterium cacticida]|uniref:Type I secretion C-terminal target domain-containing protein n=1 Tax=Pectobacterium cacticida TaxID=69221 RepID=A0ABZ2GD02_9GAMM
MNNVVGIIKFVIGQVFVISLDGVQRLLMVGDKIYRGEEIVTGGDGAVTITLPDGRSLDVGRNSQWSDNGDITPQETPQGADEVAALQEAILQGADPTQILEATAAGNTDVGEAGDGGGSHAAVVLDLTGQIVDPTVGYPTAGIGFATDNLVETDGFDTQSLAFPLPAENNDTITLSSDDRVTEGGKITVTATVNNPVTGSDLVIGLTDGSMITIPVGETTGQVEIGTRPDDAYRQDDEVVQIGIGGTQGGSYTNLDTSSSTSTTVVDDSDATKITLTAPETVTEGGTYQVTATVDNPVTQSDLVITLTNGATVTIPVGATSGTSEPIATRPDDAYQQGDEPLNIGIDTTTGGNFEALNKDATTTVKVVDDSDAVNVTIEANGDVTEAEDAVFTIRVDTQLPDDLLVTLKNGDQITIKAGEQSAEYRVPAQGDDVYIDAGDVTAGISSAVVEGKTFENLVIGGDATAQISDTIDKVTAELSVNPNPVVEGNEVEYTITLKGPEGTNLDLSKHDGLTITLDNGKTITIAAGETSGSVKETIADDVFVGGKTQTVGIESITEKATEGSGKQFESLVKGEDVTLAITDEPGTPGNPGEPGTPNAGDAITVSITADKASFAENEEQTFTVSLDKAVDRDVVVTLDGGKTVTIAKGTTSVAYQRPEQGEDVYKDSETISVALEDAKAADGATFENLTLGDAATIQVVDTESPVTATLTANATSVAEGGEITYTVTLTGPAFADFTKHDGVKFELANGEVVEIAAGQTSGSVTITAPDDVFVGGQPAIENHIKGVLDNSDSEFEQLNTTGTTRVAVTDEPGTPGNPGEPGTPNAGDAITVSITADKASFAENEEQTFTVSLDKAVDRDVVVTLDGGKTVTIAKGTTSVAYQRPEQGEDVYKDSETISVALEGAKAADGTAFENLTLGDAATIQVVDTESPVTATLTANATSVAEGGEITYTVTLTGPAFADFTKHDGVKFELANGEVVEIAAGQTSGSVTITAPDDVFVGGQPAIENHIKGVLDNSDSEFEQLNTTGTTRVAVTDEPGTPGNPGEPGTPNAGDAITVSITADKASFAENEAQTFTVSLDKAVDRDVVVTLDGGKTVTIAKGTTSVAYQRPEQGEDVYKDGETIRVALEGAKGADNAVFENLTLGDAATIQVVDTESPVTATLTANATSVAEGGEITYTVTLTGPAFADFTKHDGVKFELANGEVVEIAAGQTSGSVTITAPDDVFVGGQPAIENHIKGVLDNSDSEFEQLNTTGTTRVAVTDEPGTPGNPGEPGTPNAGDAITVSITADKASFAENEEQTFTVSLDKAVDRDVVVTLDGGKTVTIAKGTTSVAYQRPEQGEDVYKDSETISVALEGAKAADGTAFENLTLGDAATIQVVDTESPVTATLTANATSVAEGGEITYTVTLTGPAFADFTKHDGVKFELANGEVVEIAAGQTSGSVTITAPDDVFVGGQPAIENHIKGVLDNSDSEFEQLNTTGTTRVAVTDEPGTPGNPGEPGTPNAGDAITVSITADKASFAENEEQTFTVSLDKAVDRDVVVTLDGGKTVTIAKGTTSVAYQRPEQGEDVYKDSETISVALEDAKAADGTAFENLTLGDAATIQVVDTESPVTATLTANATSVAEGGEITYTVTLTGPAFADFTKHDGVKFELANGEVVEIAAGQTSGSVTITAPDDVFVGGQPAIENHIKGVLDNSDSEFEQLNTTGTTRVAVTDEPGTPGNPGEPGTPNAGDAITVSITADKASFAENEEQTFTVSLDKAVDRDVVVTLDGGETVTIAKGTTEVAYARPAQGEDVYKDSETINVALEDAKAADGAAFENLTLGDAATIQVVDTESPVTATLTANATSVAEGGEITYTVTLTGPAFADFTKHDGVKFELANGEVVEIAAGQTSGSVTITAPDDVFVGGQPAIENHIKGVLDNSDSEFEQLNTTGTTRVAVTDEPGTPGNPGEPGTPNAGDAITVSITADKASFAENEEQTFTVSLDKAVDRDVVVTLDGGETVTIAKGTTEVAYARPAQGEDVYKDSETINVALEDAKAADGAAFENLTLGDAATIQVVDTESPVTATLTANATSVAEGGEITYTVTLTGPAFADFSQHDGVKFELANGEVVEIAAGQTSGSVTITAPDDVFVGGQPAIENHIKGVLDNSDSEFEQLNTTGTTRVAVTDEPGTPGNPGEPGTPNAGDAITVSITADKASFAENEEQTFTVSLDKAVDRDVVVTLDGGKTVTIAKGTTSVAYQRPEQGEDVYKDSETINVALEDAKAADGAAFENLTLGDAATIQVVDTESPVTATLTANATSVAEGGEITYTVTLTGPAFADFSQHDGVKFELANGEVVEIAAGQTSGSVTITAPDDVFVGGQPAIENHIKGVLDNSDSEFEQLNTTGTTRVAVTDEPGTPGNPGEPGTPNAGDAITVSITADKASFAENEEQTFTVSLDKAVDRDVVVTLDGGKTVTIAKGTTSVAYQRPEQGEDVYKDSETINVALEDAKAADGAAFENLTLGDAATIQVVDTESPVTATLTANATSVAEGGEITYTVTLTGPAFADFSQHDGVKFELANGEVVEIAAGQTSGSVTITAPDDVFVGGQPAIENHIKGVLDNSDSEFEQLNTTGTTRVAVTDEPGTPGNPGEPGTPNAGDAITVSITADKASFAENEEQTFTVSLDKAVDRDVVVTLDGGKTVTIAKGTTSVAYQRPEQGEDVYKDSETISVALEGAKAADGTAFENLTLGDAATIQVVDTESPVTATLTANATSVAEGGEITYTVTLTGPAFADFTKHDGVKFELANGEVVEIAAGQTSGSVTITAPDDVFVGGQPAIENHIKGVLDNSDSEFEQLNTTGTTRVAVTDEPGTPGNPGEPGTPNAGDAITVSITADKASFAENEEQTFTVSLDKAVDRDVVVTLDGGETVTIAKGTTEVAYARPAQGEDVYKDSETINVALEDAKAADGAAFENLTLGDAATIQVVDTESPVTATLTANATSVAEGGEITYTVTLTGPAFADFSQHDGVKFELANGEVVEIAAGQTSGSVTITAPDDVFVGGQPAIENHIKGVLDNSDSEFEQLNTTGTTRVAVTDEPGTPGNPGEPGTPNAGDAITVSITADKASFAENEEQTFTVSLDKAVDRDVVVTLDGGKTVTIAKGTTSVAYQRPEQGEDVYKDSETISVALEDAKAADGATFENLTLGDAATIQVVDTESPVTATLTANATSVAEGGEITYTVTLTGPAFADFTKHDGVKFELANGEVVEIAAGQTSGSVTITAPDDVFVGGQPAIENHIKGVLDNSDSEFEQLNTTGTTRVAVTDEPGTPGNPGEPGTPNAGDKVTLTLDDVTVNEGTGQTTIAGSLDHAPQTALTVTLSNGATITFGPDYVAGTKVSSTPFDINNGEDVYKDASSFELSVTDATGGNFENLDTSDKAVVTVADTINEVTAELSVSPNPVVEGNEVEYTITLKGPEGADLSKHDGLTITLDNGKTITIAAGETSGSVKETIADDVFVGGKSQDVSIQTITERATVDSGKQFESLVAGEKVTLAITDEPGTPGNPGEPGTPNAGDKVTLTLDDVTVNEGTGQTTIAGSLDHAPQTALTVTLSNGATITFGPDYVAGTKVSSTPFDINNGEDVYKDASSFELSVTDASGGNFENLDTSDKAVVTVADTINEVTAELSVSPNPVVEGNEVEYTVTLTGPEGADLSKHDGLTIALSNGKTIEIAAGQTTGSVKETIADDAFVGGKSQDVSIQTITERATVDSGKQFESLVAGEKVTLAITDEPGTPGNPGEPGTPNAGDKVTLTLDDVTVNEGTGQTTIAGSLDHAPQTALTVTLSNGATITFGPDYVAGTKVSSTPFDINNGEDVYKDASSFELSVTDATGGNFENLDTSDKAVVTVADTINEVTATLSAIGQPKLGGTITYQVELSNKDNLPIDRHGEITVTLESGKTITIEAGKTLGEITVTLEQSGQVVDKIVSITVDGDTQFEAELIKAGEINLSVTNIAPVVGTGTAVVSEEGLSGGIKDDKGTSDTTDSASASGKLDIHDPDSSSLTVSLVAPQDGALQSGGIDVKWTVADDGKALTGKAGDVEVMRVKIDDAGEYTVDLKAPVDHPVKGVEDTLSFDIGVQVSDESSTVNSKIAVVVEDDSPEAQDTEQVLNVPVSDIVLTDLQGGFANVNYARGANGDSRNTDSDPYYETLRWGGDTGYGRSGYDYYDNEAYRENTDNLLGSTFKLGSFSHINFPVTGATLDTTDLVVKFNVTIDGVSHEIEHTIKLKHTETPNSESVWVPGNWWSPGHWVTRPLPLEDQRDIVEIDQATLTKTFTVGDRTFEFTIDGFKNNEYGDPVSKVYTWEDAVNKFDLYATISAVDDMPRIEGKLDGDLYGFGADGAGDEKGIVWENAEKQPDGSYKIVNEYGTFIGKADGSYTFEMSREARDNMTVNEQDDIRFTYSVIDADGDGASADLVLVLKGTPNNMPEQKAPEVELTLTAETEEITLPGGGFDGDDQNPLGGAWKVVQGPVSTNDADKGLLTVDDNNISRDKPVRVESTATVDIGKLPDNTTVELDIGWNNGITGDSGPNGAPMQAIIYFNGVALLQITTPDEVPYDWQAPGNYEDENGDWIAPFPEGARNAAVEVLRPGTSFVLNGVEYSYGEQADLLTWAKNYLETGRRNDPDYLDDKLSHISIKLPDDALTKDGDGKLAVEYWTPKTTGVADDIQIGSFKLVVPDNSGDQPGEGVKTTFKAAVVITDDDSTMLSHAEIKVNGFTKDDVLKLYGDNTFHVDRGDNGTLMVSADKPQHIDAWNKFLSHLEFTTTDTAGKAISITVTDAEGNASKPATESLSAEPAAALAAQRFSAVEHVDDSTLDASQPHDDLAAAHRVSTLLDEHGSASSTEGAVRSLIGGDGDDILIAGSGDTILTGGKGADTFTWQKGDFGHDIVKDFNPDEGDKLDLSGLLNELNGTADIASYIRTNMVDGSQVIEVSTKGDFTGEQAAKGGTVDVSITLEGYTGDVMDHLIAKPENHV